MQINSLTWALRAISKSEIFDLKSAPIALRSLNFGVKNQALESGLPGSMHGTANGTHPPTTPWSGHEILADRKHTSRLVHSKSVNCKIVF
jgi:hypothetical protein